MDLAKHYANEGHYEAGFWWHIKGGTNINIWRDPWVPEVSGFVPKLKLRAIVERRTNYVSDLINRVL